MDINRIKILLQDFYDGETSPEEEKILSDYFKSERVADELAQEKEIFLHLYNSENTIDVPPTLEVKLENLIDGLANEQKKIETKPKSRKLVIWIGSVAASVAILLSVGLYFKENQHETVILVQKENQIKDNKVTTSEEASIEEAQKALVLLAQNFNKGVNQINRVSENIEKTNKILDKTFNRKKDIVR